MADNANSNHLCGSPVTIQWLEKTLKEKAGGTERDKVLEWSAERIGVGQGFLSHIIRVRMTWTNGNSLPSSVVLKVPTAESLTPQLEKLAEDGPGNTEDKQAASESMIDVWLPLAMKNECALYALFRENPPCPVAHTWYGEEYTNRTKPGVLVMEDLSERGALVSICDGLSPAQVYSIAEGLAGLHSFSMKNQGKWEDKFPTLPRDAAKDFPKMMEGASAQLLNSHPHYFKGKSEVMCESMTVDAVFSAALSHEELGLPPVLVNGDMWTNNMIFERMENGNPGDKLIAFLDWQGAHQGNLAEDMARVLVSSTTPEHYYKVLQEKMSPDEVPFGIDDVMKAYNRILAYAMGMYIFGLPIMMNSPIVGEGEEERKKNVERMMLRGKCIVDDVIALQNNK